MTAQEMFEALHKSQIKAKRLMRKNKKLKRRFNKLNRALDVACTKLEGLCTVIDILTDKDTAHDKEYWKKKVMEDVD